MLQETTTIFSSVNEKHLVSVLQKVEPFCRKISWEVADSITTPDDAFQEAQIEVIKTVRKIQEEKSFDDLVCICLNSLRLYRQYAWRASKRVADKASSSSDVSEIEETYKPSSFAPSADSQLIRKELLERVTVKLKEFDFQYPGIFDFFQEAIEPSLPILEKLEEYKKTVTNQRGLNGSNIPPLVLARLMEIGPGRLKTFKLVFKKVLKSSGVSSSLVEKYCSLA